MNIGDVSTRSGLPTKTIRYYEEIGLVSPVRGENGYRSSRDCDLHRLAFLARARSLGFSLDDCRSLLELYYDRDRASADVREIAHGHLDRIDRKIAELQSLSAALSQLVEHCNGDTRPDCPIIDDLASLR